MGPAGACTAAGWSPDGEWMYFNVKVDGGAHLWRQRFPNGVPEQITFGPTEEEGLAVAPDGKSLIASIGVRQSSVWVKDATGDHRLSVEGSASQGQFSGNSWREQVMTRQPAEAKRLTVAWPMPREAPVRIRVFFSASGVVAMQADLARLATAPKAAEATRFTRPTREAHGRLARMRQRG